MNEVVERLVEWKERGEGRPFLLEIWPTNRCNLKCKMCGTWASRRRLEKNGVKYDPKEEIKNEVSDERLVELIDEAKELGVYEVLITGGGEPFLRKELTLKLMERIKAYGLSGNLNTNGTLFSRLDIKRIVEIGWDKIMFSIDAPDAKIHDFIRGVNGTFKKVKKSLMEFKKVKNKLKVSKPQIVFNTVLTKFIVDRIDKMIKFASKVGCEDITFIPLIIYDRSMERIDLSKEDKIRFQKKIGKFIEISKKLNVNTNLEKLFLPAKRMNEIILREMKNSPNTLIYSPCFEPFLHFLVKANGEATCCCMLENSPENIKLKSMKEIWIGGFFNQLRKDFINKRIRKECKFCVFSQFIKNKEIRKLLKEI